jgi:hypothetical protein
MLPIANFFARQARLDPNDVRNRNAARRRAQSRD